MLNEMLKTVFDPPDVSGGKSRILSGKKMKKAIVGVILCLLYSTFLLAQVDTAWVERYNGPGNSSDEAYAMAVDGAGNVYVTGYSRDSGGGGINDDDYATVKYNSLGVEQWVARYNGTYDGCDKAKAITLDGAGNVYVTGEIGGPGYPQDYATVKYDSLGVEQWVRIYNGPGNSWDIPEAIAVDDTGNVYVTGSSPGSGTSSDYATVKYNSLGEEKWVARYDNVGEDYARAMTVDGAGNVYVTGETRYGSYSIDYATVKYNSGGVQQWVRTYDGPVSNAIDRAAAIAVDGAGNVYVTGWSYSDTDYDYATVKYNSLGVEQWVARYNGPVDGGDNPRAIAVDGAGNVYVTGSQTVIKFPYWSYCDYATLKYDSLGVEQWVKTYNGPVDQNDVARAIAVDGSGNVYVTGESYGSGTSRDYATIKYNSSGAEQWVETYNGPGNSDDMARAIAVDGEYVYVTGGSSGSGTGLDYATIKYVPAGIIGDFNSDGYVDATDLQMFGDHWLFVDTDTGWDALYDLVLDGIIDAADLQVLGDHWNEGTPPKSDSGKSGKGPNEFAGIVFDLDAITYGNQNLTSIPSQPAGTNIRVDVYCTGVHNLDTYQFEVIYDPTELAYVVASASNMVTLEPNILTTNGGEAIGWMINSSTPGVLSLAYTLTGTDPAQAPEGEGLIADIVFLSLVDTYGTLSFGDVYYYDTYGVVDLITDTGTATLPVELSSFTAAYNTVSGFVSLYWATASETDVNGFNIYRNTEDSFGEAVQINIDLIEGSGTTTETTEYGFTDETADPYYTTYYYWLEVINFGGNNDKFGPYKYIPIDVNNNGELDIITSILSPCYPNPARIGNEIKFSFRVGGLEGTARNVELKVYNILGKLVAEVVNGERLVNDYTETWRPDNLSNGVYFYQLKTDNYSEVKKMLIQ